MMLRLTVDVTHGKFPRNIVQIIQTKNRFFFYEISITFKQNFIFAIKIYFFGEIMALK